MLGCGVFGRGCGFQMDLFNDCLSIFIFLFFDFLGDLNKLTDEADEFVLIVLVEFLGVL